MIISGYPGIGKSTICKNSMGCIDFDSSSWPKDNEDWYKPYYNAAKVLSDQGYIVFVSSHREVLESLGYFDNTLIIAPAPELQEQWLIKLRDRYLLSRDPKDERAFEHCLKNWDQDHEDMKTSRAPLLYIPDMGYKLEDVIFTYVDSNFETCESELDILYRLNNMYKRSRVYSPYSYIHNDIKKDDGK